MKVRNITTYEMLKEQIAALGDGASKYNMEMLDLAYAFASEAHGDQKRVSGEPYIVHPLNVASILIDLGMDTESVCAGLLHDVVEDTNYTLKDIEKAFGESVCRLVDGMTDMKKMQKHLYGEDGVEKISRTLVGKEDEKMMNFSKTLLYSVRDLRVMVIKLADRLHNTRTLEHLSPERRGRIANETLKVYSSIAEFMGIYSIKNEMEENCLKMLDPVSYQELEEALFQNREYWEQYVKEIQRKIQKTLLDSEIAWKNPPQLSGRVKGIYSIFRKMRLTKEGEAGYARSLDEIYDIYAVRVIVTTEAECYHVRSIVESIPEFTMVPGRHKDYIKQPKNNGYQSLHDTMIYKGTYFEVQIRTVNMHEKSEFGAAAHWKYKGGKIINEVEMQRIITGLRNFCDTISQSDDPTEIRDVLLEQDWTKIFIYTPRGDVKQLPYGATVLDFAYSIHEDIGNKAVCAMVNGKKVGKDYMLHNQDRCDVICSKEPGYGPNILWLQSVKTTSARTKIRRALQRKNTGEQIRLGRELLKSSLRRWGIKIGEREYPIFFQDLLMSNHWSGMDNLYQSVGAGRYQLEKHKVALYARYEELTGTRAEGEKITDLKALEQELEEKLYSKSYHSRIQIDGNNNNDFHLARCCNPLPGMDDVVGFVTRGYGYALHRTTCENYLRDLREGNPERLNRWKQVDWCGAVSSEQEFLGRVLIYTMSPNFVMGEILKVAQTLNILVVSISRSPKQTNSKTSILEVNIKVNRSEDFKLLMQRLQEKNEVLWVQREL